MLLILQNVISASQNLATMEEIVIIPAMDTSAVVDTFIMGTTATEVIIASVFIV